MLTSTVKTILASGLMAAGLYASSIADSHAGDYSIGLHIGGQNGGIYIGNGYQQVHHRSHRRYEYRDRTPRHGRRYDRRHRRICTPNRAVNKAWNMGMNNPHIARVGENRIVVKGHKRGYRAKVVFSRWSRHCEVIKVRGLRWR